MSSKSNGRRSRSNSEAILRAPSRNSLERLLIESQACNGPIMMHDEDPTWLFRIVQLVVFLTRLVTPISYLYVFGIVIASFLSVELPTQSIIFWILSSWMLIEALFFPYYYSLFTQLNSPNDDLQHFASDSTSRTYLLEKCFSALLASGRKCQDPPEFYIRQVMQGWFLEDSLANVHFDNVAAWTGWAFFGKDYKLMSESETTENVAIVRYIEAAAKWTFPPGYHEQTPALRLNLDPIFATQRPFFFYASIAMLNAFTHGALWLFGFRIVQHAKPISQAQKIYLRRGVGDTRATKLPVVFVHGIGVGFAHYLGLIAGLPRDVDVFLVEWPYVAMQMATRGPTVDEAVNHVIAVLDHYQHPKACFLAHSLGTTLVSWMLHDERGARRVARSILLDPIVFLLCDPTVASVFVYKDPSSVVDLLMHFFLSRELFIANALSRHFAWSHNILFVEDLLNNHSCCRQRPHLVVPTWVEAGSGHSLQMHLEGSMGSEGSNKAHHWDHKEVEHTVIMSTNDSIVPIPAVARYLQAKAEEGFRNFEVIYFEGLHGELLLWPQWIRRILGKVDEHTAIAPMCS